MQSVSTGEQATHWSIQNKSDSTSQAKLQLTSMKLQLVDKSGRAVIRKFESIPQFGGFRNT